MESHLLQMRGLKHTYAGRRQRCCPSHLLQMRGLKQPVGEQKIGMTVASFTDAWIETATRCATSRRRRSHLLQMRGLKPCHSYVPGRRIRSHLLQMRGLKHRSFAAPHHCGQSHLLQMRGLKQHIVLSR